MPKPWNVTQLQRALRRRRQAQVCGVAAVAVLMGLIIADHLGAFGYHGDDWAAYDHQIIQIDQSQSADTVLADNQPIHLLGVAGVGGKWDRAACDAIDQARDKSTALLMDWPQVRDTDGRLRAYLFLNDTDELNRELVLRGLAVADRREDFHLAEPIDQAESDARRHKRGLWTNPADILWPAWRTQWLADRAAHLPAAVRELQQP